MILCCQIGRILLFSSLAFQSASQNMRKLTWIKSGLHRAHPFCQIQSIYCISHQCDSTSHQWEFNQYWLSTCICSVTHVCQRKLSKMSAANYIFTLVWPMFFSYCGLLGWNVVRSGTLPGFSQKLLSLPPLRKEKILGPRKCPVNFPTCQGRQVFRRDVFFWMKSICSLHRSGAQLIDWTSPWHPARLELAKPPLDRRGKELVAQFTKHNTNIIIVHRTVA